MALNYRTQYQTYRNRFSNLTRAYRTKAEVKLYFELTLTLITISFFIVFAIRPTTLTIVNLIQDLKSQQDLSQQLDQKIASVNLAQTNYQKHQPKFQTLDLALPSTPLPTLFLQQIESLTLIHGLTLANLSIGDIYLIGSPNKPASQASTPASSISSPTTSFTVTVQGQYPNLKTFLHDLENLQRLNLISNFNFRPISKSQQEASQDDLSLTVTGQLPFSYATKS